MSKLLIGTAFSFLCILGSTEANAKISTGSYVNFSKKMNIVKSSPWDPRTEEVESDEDNKSISNESDGETEQNPSTYEEHE